GKRVDYSGRSVIVSGPDLTIDQCGLPKTMALELFKPFVIAKLLEWDQAHNIHSAQRLIETGSDVVWDALDEAIKGKYVLLNRAPTLHRLGIQAFQPKLIEGQAIQISPLVTTGFNADFDGDQMAIHLPLSVEAQAEARDLMSATNNLLKPSDGSPILSIYQDIVLGSYFVSYLKPSAQQKVVRVYSSVNEAEMARDAGVIEYQTLIKLPIDGSLVETTLGRARINELLPNDFPYINEVLTKKKLSAVLARVFNDYGAETTADCANKIKDLALKFATMSGLSIGMNDFATVDQLDEVMSAADDRTTQIAAQFDQGLITGDERYKLTVATWRKVDDDVTDLLKQAMAKTDTSVGVMVDSGARGNITNVKWVSANIGVTVDAFGNESELPVKSGFRLGLDPLESFLYSRSTRKGLIDTALKTADSGYLTRRLVDVAQDVFTVPDTPDSDDGYTIYRSETEETMIDFGERLYGRYAAKDVPGYVKAGRLITRDIADAIQNDENVQEATIMSILSTKQLDGIPQKSYGVDMATGYLVAEHEPVGVIAAQSVGEPGTQLTLNTFHQGGAADAADITQGLPRVEELFEARTPKGEAFIADISGDVEVWEDNGKYVVQITPTEGETKRIKLASQIVRVKSGSDVAAGDVLASNEDESLPLVAPFDGKVSAGDGELIVTGGAGAPLKYEIPSYKQLTVKSGDVVKIGDRLTTGSINLRQLMSLKGVEATERYIINDVLRIYAAQGQTVSSKHLEVIVRQMFSRVQIDDSGDSQFVEGDILSKAKVVEENNRLTSEGKTPAAYTQLLLGITKVAIYSDSFLSAASFQDTTRVLIAAATAGKVDHLNGLKENVIIGRKIPVGTGALPEARFTEEEFGDLVAQPNVDAEEIDA
ncbi:MAG: DNA-directed RNA polymerase subunit beta', partial [Candidatus Nomurabacteria bacterium]|nr:DNA-directed RNA polymerase subunit beta' [Candidatus Nomurabacteria bacterium]